MVDTVKKTILVVLLSVFMFSLLTTTVLAFKGNVNGDCEVDIADVVKVAISFGAECDNSTCSDGHDCWGNYSTCVTKRRWNPVADLNLDEIVDIVDLVRVVLDFGKKEPVGTTCEYDGFFCTVDQCDGSGNCEYQGDYDCSDDLFCTVNENCDEGLDACVHDDRDCSANDLTGIETCTNDPDLNPFTWDFREAFTSLCDEDLDVCTNGDGTITHTCDKASCQAECDATNPCADTDCDYLDDCYDGKYRDYSDVGNTCQTDCTCTDNSCTSYVETGTDGDGDGWDIQCEDCNDADDEMFPGNPEVCDGKDNDCDGEIDEGVLLTFYQDNDDDTYGNASVSTQACTAPSGYVSDNTDCDDSDPDVNPGATEFCDGLDNDCDDSVDEDPACDGCVKVATNPATQGMLIYVREFSCSDVWTMSTNEVGVAVDCDQHISPGAYYAEAFSGGTCQGENSFIVDDSYTGSTVVPLGTYCSC